MRHALALALTLVACDSGPGDPGGSVDARLTGTATDVVCQPYTRTVTAPDGARTVTTVRYGAVAEVGPDDDFTVELCGATNTASQEDCAAGFTCTGSTRPAGTQCERSHRSGSFVNGHLLVYCGQSSQGFNAAGAMTSSFAASYASVRVIR